MRGALLLALSVLLCGAAGEEEGPRHLDLSAYVGQDLRDAGKSEQLHRLIRDCRKVLGVEMGEDTGAAYPWFVAPFRCGATRHILFEGYEGPNVPDVSYGRVHRFGEGWAYLGRSDFLSGYRMFLAEARVVSSKALARPLLLVKTTCQGPFVLRDGKKTPAFEQGAFQLQYYAIVSDRVALVRLEDDRGRIVVNSYATSVPFKGPDVSRRDAAFWRKAIRSSDPAVVLEALVWLTGHHMSSAAEREPHVNRESVESSRTFETVCRDPEVRKLAAALRTHENRWIREYAALVPAPSAD